MSFIKVSRRHELEPGGHLLSSLRAATQRHHRALEDDLRLLDRPLSEQRFKQVVCRFFGFHRAWEPAIAQHASLRSFHLARQRTLLLRADLLALGLSDAVIDTLPACESVRQFASDEATAMGSVYVMEGSTLGGQVISRALSEAPWAPPGGLRSFNPYGEETGRMWRECRAWLEREGERHDPGDVISGAQQCFVTLGHWLTS